MGNEGLWVTGWMGDCVWNIFFLKACYDFF